MLNLHNWLLINHSESRPLNENLNLLVRIKFLNLFCIYSLTCLTGHLCPTVTLRPAQLILLYNLTLFNGHLSNAANGHLFHAWIVRSSSNNGHFGHLITWHNVHDRSHDMVTFKIINNRWREIQLIELVI